MPRGGEKVSSVRYKKDHNGKTFCPIVSAACHQWSECIEDECEWWYESGNDDYSCCALLKIVRDTSSIGYAVARGE